jgi:hypothetical protein
VDDAIFQQWLSIINSATPPDGHSAALALQAAWQLVSSTKDKLGDLTTMSPWSADNSTTLQNQMEDIAGLAYECESAPAPLQPELVYRVRAAVAGAFISARAALESLGAVADQYSFGGVVDYFRNWSTYAGQGAQAVGAGLEHSLAWALEQLLNSRLFQLGALAAIALYLKGK